MDLILATSPTDTYISFFLSRPTWDVWNLFLLGMARIVPIIAIAPFLGGKAIPDPVKIGFGIALTPLFLPFLIVHAQSGPLNVDIIFFLLLAKEALIGTLLGILIAMPFYYSQAAGTLIDHQRGSQSLQVTDPATQIQASPTGLLYNNVMIVTFFAIGGPILFFQGVYSSYQVLPADQFVDPALFSLDAPLWNTLLKYFTTLITISLQLSAPAVIAILMSDLFLGIANRMAPQVQISFLLWSLKAFIGILILWASWWLVISQMSSQGLTWIKSVNKLIETF
ncbi:MAG: hypothetical protein KR126chlam2_00727 [Chlamydiae bacterium]|nr:hypothetical protein [Chlamydiota bacterium]